MTAPVEFATEADLPELFTLFAETYRFNPRLREKDYFDWQYRDTPVRLGDGAYDFLVTRDDHGRIIGHLGVVGFELSSGGRQTIAGWAENWSAKGQGKAGMALFTRFLELADNRLQIRTSDIAWEIARLSRIPRLPAIPRWCAVTDAERAADLFGPLSQADHALLAQSQRRVTALPAATGILAVDRFDSADDFGCGQDVGVAFHARRNGGFLNWRYVDIPRHDYQAVRSERAVGVYRVERIMDTDIDVLRLLEWTFGADETPRALAAILGRLHPASPLLIDFHCTCRPLAEPLLRCGFFPAETVETPLPDLFRPRHRSGGYRVAIDLPPHRVARHIDFDQWYITLGDSDTDRKKL